MNYSTVVRKENERGIRSQWDRQDPILSPAAAECVSSARELDRLRELDKSLKAKRSKTGGSGGKGRGSWERHALSSARPYLRLVPFRLVLEDGTEWKGFASFAFLRVLRRDGFFPLFDASKKQEKTRKGGSVEAVPLSRVEGLEGLTVSASVQRSYKEAQENRGIPLEGLEALARIAEDEGETQIGESLRWILFEGRGLPKGKKRQALEDWLANRV